MKPSLPPFSILDHLDNLTSDEGSHGKHEGSYYCPVCEAKNFKVNHKTGKYKGYGCRCTDTAAGRQKVREAIFPLEEALAAAAACDWRKPSRPKQYRTWIYHDQKGQPLIEVQRWDDGAGRRIIRQQELQAGTVADLKLFARPYHYQNCLDAIQSGKKVLWVEGEPCADALWRLNIPATTTLSGSNNYRSEQYRDLFPADSLVICPDQDQQGLKYAEAIAADYPEAQWCYAFPQSFLWKRLPQSGGADMADWIEAGATAEDILATVGDKRPSAQHFSATRTSDTSSVSRSDKAKSCVLRRAALHIEAHYASQLRLNQFTKAIELDDAPIDLSDFRIDLAIEENLDLPLEKLEGILKRLAKRNPYHPVQEYLTGCHQRYSDTSILDSLAERYFGSRQLIYNIFLKRTLIAAVARAFEPGCKVDHALILQGKQGLRKSSFFKVLAGEDYFDDSLGGVSDKDERLKLHLAWIIEWAELESVFRRKDLAATKAFLSSSVDVVRPPYARQAERLERQSIIVGTTNQDQFLSDSTGNRRFWVIPVQHEIDLEQLRQERDQIWGAAVALYQAGEQWWLTEAEERQAEQLIDEYLTADPWQSKIEAYLIEWRLSVVTGAEILNNCLEIEPRFQAKRDQMRIADCLRRLGWGKTRKTHQGKRQHVWIQPDPPDQPGPTDEPKVDPPENPSVTKDSGNGAQPAQPKTPFLESEYGIGQQTDIQGWKEAYTHIPYNNHGVLTERLLE